MKETKKTKYLAIKIILRNVLLILYKDYKELVELNVQLTSLVGKIEGNSTRRQKEQQQKINVLQAELNRMKVQYDKLSEKLKQKSEKLSHYFPRNVGKREKRKKTAFLKKQ